MPDLLERWTYATTLKALTERSSYFLGSLRFDKPILDWSRLHEAISPLLKMARLDDELGESLVTY
jgi:hypothetical protein